MVWHDLLQSMAARLGRAGFEASEARYVLEWATGTSYAEWVVAGGVVQEAAVRRAEDALGRRLLHEPLAYIMGRREFFGLELAVNPSVLIPRPETEILVEAVLNAELPEAARVVDVGTGSGAIALVLKARRPDLRVIGADVSPAALDVAKANGARLGIAVEWVESDLLSRVPRPIDVVAANLPYIDPGWADAAPELSYEPRLALYAEEQGLALIRQLLRECPMWLAGGGQIFLEGGAGQLGAMADLAKTEGFGSVAVLKDYAGLDRVLRARWGGHA